MDEYSFIHPTELYHPKVLKHLPISSSEKGEYAMITPCLDKKNNN